MKKNLSYVFLLAGITSLPAMAHVTYTGRNFGTFNDTLATSTISNQAVTGNYGWVQATDAYGDAHKTLAYRFTLTEPTNVMLSFESQVFTPANPGASPVLGGLAPGFSLYQGLAHVAPMNIDYDSSAISKANRPSDAEGAFRALNDWKVGNDPNPENGTPASLSFFKYVGSAYDGTGSGSDGLLDGKVSHTFMHLGAGDYSVFMGGSDLSAKDITNPNLLSKYGVTGTLVSAVPEPETYAMLLAGLGLMASIVRRRKSQGNL